MKDPNKNPAKTTLFHDGDCPLCKVEVKAMKKLDIKNRIDWVDITKDKAALKNAGISYEQAMARIHVTTENNETLTGVIGFIQVWKHLPYYRRIAWVIEKTPFLLPIAEVFYSFFAKHRLLLTGKKPLFNRSKNV